MAWGTRFKPGRFTLALAVITVAGFVGRVLYLHLARGHQVTSDGLFYVFYAHDLVDGTMPGTRNPPGWTFTLAGAHLVGLESIWAQQVFTALIGTATVAVIGLAARRVAGPRVGLIAAALAAVYPGMWLYERELLSEPLTMLAVAATILFVYRFHASPSFGRALGLGALVGISSSIRSELIVVSVLVVVPVVLGRVRVDVRRRLGWLVGAGALSVALLMPWMLYNTGRYENPVLLSTGLGAAMRTGNCGPAYEAESLGYYKFGCIALPPTSSDPSIADGQLRRAAMDHMRSVPGRAAVAAAARVGRTFNLYRPLQQAQFETERGSALRVTQAAMVSYWILLPVGVAGAVLLRRRRTPIYPLLAYPVIVVLAVLPTIGAVRYRAIAEPVLVILAAVPIEASIRRRLAAATPADPEATERDGTGDPLLVDRTDDLAPEPA